MDRLAGKLAVRGAGEAGAALFTEDTLAVARQVRVAEQIRQLEPIGPWHNPDQADREPDVETFITVVRSGAADCFKLQQGLSTMDMSWAVFGRAPFWRDD